MSNPTITQLPSPNDEHDPDLECADPINRAINSITTAPFKSFRYSEDHLRSELNSLINYVERNHEPDKNNPALQKLQKELIGYACRKLPSTTEFEFHIINYSNSADSNRIHTARDIHSAKRHIFPIEDHCNCPEPATQGIPDVKVQILLHASKGVPKKATLMQLMVRTGFAPERHISDMFSRFATRLLLAFLVVKWEVKPSDFLPAEPVEGQKLPPFRSEIRLPSTLRNIAIGPAFNQKIIWFRTAPKLIGSFKALGGRNCYNQRPDFKSATIYLAPGVQLVPKAFLVFNNTEALRDFSTRLESNLTEATTLNLPTLLIPLKHLLLQIIQDGADFLGGIALGINKAKYNGLKSPSKIKVEYLIHVEDYLREMPSILDTTIQSFRTLSVHLNIGIGWIGEAQEDIDYLKKMSEELHLETTSIMKMVNNHIVIAQTAQMGNLTFLASIFIPLSFLAAYYGMNFDATNQKDHPGLNIKIFWAIGIPLTFTAIILPRVVGHLIRFFTVVDAPGLGRLFAELFMFSICLFSRVLSYFSVFQLQLINVLMYFLPLMIICGYWAGLLNVAIHEMRSKCRTATDLLCLKKNKQVWVTISTIFALLLLIGISYYLYLTPGNTWALGMVIDIPLVIILFGYRWFLRNRSQKIKDE